MRFIPALIGVLLLHVVAIVSSVFNLVPVYWRIIWGSGVDLAWASVLLIIAFLPSFIVGFLVNFTYRLKFRKVLGACFSNLLVEVVGFTFTGLGLGFLIDAFTGNSTYVLFVAWEALMFPLHFLVVYLGAFSTYLLLGLVLLFEK